MIAYRRGQITVLDWPLLRQLCWSAMPLSRKSPTACSAAYECDILSSNAILASIGSRCGAHASCTSDLHHSWSPMAASGHGSE